MKRNLSIIVCLILIINTVINCMFVSAKETNDYSMGEQICMKMGIYESENYAPDKYVSRGDFAKILCKMLNLPAIKVETDIWTDYFTSDDDLQSSQKIFDDVDISHPDYAYIKAVTEAGYMNGISDNLFAADVNLTPYQVFRVFLDMAGYGVFVTQNGGYLETAISIGACKGVNVSSNNYLTYSDLSKIIYNMLDINVIEQKFNASHEMTYMKSDKETFMTYALNIKSLKGTLTDNGYVSINGESDITKDSIKIDDVVIKLTPKTEYIRNYLGRRIEIYYRFDRNDDESNEAVYATVNDKNDVYTFEAEDFISYSGSRISFYNENGKEKNVALSNIQYMIYNNKAVGKFDKSIFDIYSGSITVIPKFNNTDSLIIITSYEYYFVSSVNRNDEIICNSIDVPNMDKQIILKDYEDVQIFSEDGEEIGITDIKPNDTLEITGNDKWININVYKNVIDAFIVNSISSDEHGRTVIKNDGAEYVISKQLENATNMPTVEIGKAYTVYLNSKDEVVWAIAGESSNDVGFLIRATYDDDEPDVMLLKICGMNGKINIYRTAEKYTIDDSEGIKRKNLTGAQAMNILSGLHELIRYKKNKEGDITYIELPMLEMPETDNRLYKIVDTEKYSLTNYPYTWNGNGFGCILDYNNSTQFLYVPRELTREDEYEKITNVTNMFIASYNKRPFMAYSIRGCDYFADYIIAKQMSNEVKNLGNTRDFLSVKNISQGLDKNDEPIYVISGYLAYGVENSTNTKEVDMYVKESDINVIEQMYDIVGSTDSNGDKKVYSLSAGDIIRVAYDTYNYITLADLAFRPTLDNPVSESAGKGAIPGTTGYWNTTDKYSNPVSLTTSGDPQTIALRSFTGINFTLSLSWMCDKTEDTYRFTTQPLSTGEKFLTDGGGKYMVQARNLASLLSSKLIYIEYKNGKVIDMRLAEPSDIKLYEDYGVHCSRFLHNWWYGGNCHGFIINGY